MIIEAEAGLVPEFVVRFPGGRVMAVVVAVSKAAGVLVTTAGVLLLFVLGACAPDSPRWEYWDGPALEHFTILLAVVLAVTLLVIGVAHFAAWYEGPRPEENGDETPDDKDWPPHD